MDGLEQHPQLVSVHPLIPLRLPDNKQNPAASFKTCSKVENAKSLSHHNSTYLSTHLLYIHACIRPYIRRDTYVHAFTYVH